MPMNKAWAVTRGGAVYKFDGTSWSLITQLYANTGIYPQKCFIRIFNVDTDIWISAMSTSGSNQTRMYHYNGSTWTYYSLNAAVFQFAGPSSSDIWAIARDSTGNNNEWWHWNGVTWSSILTASIASSGNHCLIACAGASSLWSADASQFWVGVNNFRRYNGVSWTVDDYTQFSDGRKSDVGSFALFYDGTNYYHLTVVRDDWTHLYVYSRAGIGTGYWTYHSTISIPWVPNSGNLNWGKCFYKVDTKFFAIAPKEPEGSYGGYVYFKEGSGSWGAVTPANVERLMCLDGDNNGNIWVGGTKFVSGNSNRALWYRDVSTGSWTEYVLGRVVGEDNVICDVDADFFQDVTNPYVANPLPDPDSTGISIDYVPSIDLKDNETGVNPDETKIWVDGELIFDGGVSYAPWTVTPTVITNGYHYSMAHSTPLPKGAEVTIRIYGEDLASVPNNVDYSWHFETLADTEAPYLENQDPEPDETGIQGVDPIYLDLLDDITGVTLSTVRIWVDGTLAYRGDTDVFLDAYDVPASTRTPLTKGHRFHISHSSIFDSYATIPVRVYAKDNYDNELDTTYQFQIEDYVNPLIDSNLPVEPGQSRDVRITFSTRDLEGSGVDEDTITVTVNGQAAIVSGVFTPAFSGPASAITPNGDSGFDVVIDKVGGYDTYQDVDVHVAIQDHSGNPGSRDWSFKIIDYLGPEVHPTSPAADEVNVPISSPIVVQVTDAMDIVDETFKIYVSLASGADYILAFDMSASPMFQPGFDGPESALEELIPGEHRSYQVTIDPTADFEYAVIVHIRVEVIDSNGNAAILV